MRKSITEQKGIENRKFTDEELRFLIDTDPDFINSPQHGYSITKLLADKKDGVPESKIAIYLNLPRHEVDALYQSAIAKLRDHLEVDIPTPALTHDQITTENSDANKVAKQRLRDSVELDTKGGRKGK